ncbi:type VI secretion system tip protein VgrG (plasmid) [Paraburkholderia sprentiae WSM5005]|uniref:Type VI secretion system tip protein VgrG n=1 Tax=Paraburkholderia sprentiae WSM5005 TaxID=754502 RepID=A0A1I9YUX6_9BURK|nr:type VI secretion system tip protein TssI/VgrG [Paraburkholderia sprentiae]APA90019.1 type VI secretion system tip protein VgrG [Paraburkholderia sprentiae WSM5005]
MSTNALNAISVQSRAVTVSSAAIPQWPGQTADGRTQPALAFKSLKGGEYLGQLFEYELLLRTPDDYTVPLAVSANIDLKALLGKEMTVAIDLEPPVGPRADADAGQRQITGLVAAAQYLCREGRYNVYRVVLKPWLWLATLTTDYKIFQNKTVIEIIDEVLKDYPYPVEKRLDVSRYSLGGESPANEPRAFQVQYGETDYDFIHRLMEEWGIYWFFEHADGKHRLVLCDHIGAHRESPNPSYRTLAFQPQGGKTDTEYISAFSTAEVLCTGHYVTSDFDFTRSRADMRAINQQPRDTSWNLLERYDWPGDYTDGSHGELLARTRMEALRAPGTRAQGEGNVRGLACGQTFVLTSYDYTAANCEYLVIGTELGLTGTPDESGSGYEYTCSNKFDVQPTSEVFRLPQRTSKPTVSGPQSAVVVGPEGKELWTDEFGRVKVRFAWDRYGRNVETDSCWVRVSQAWAGQGFGGIYIPRIGQEVIVDFWNGDPDRPLITGSLYNTATRPPYDLPGNATQSGFMSRSMEGGLQNYNSIRFEDKAGAEEFTLQAERDMNRLTKLNESHVVGADYTIGVAAAHSMTVGAASSTIVSGKYSVRVKDVAFYSVGLAQSTMIGGAEATAVGGASALTVGGARSVTVGGASSHAVGGAYSLSAGGALSIVCGASSLTMTKDGEIKLIGKKIRIQGDERVVVKGMPLELNPCDAEKGNATTVPVPVVVLDALDFPCTDVPSPCEPIVVPPPSTEEPEPSTEEPEPSTEEPGPSTEEPEPSSEEPEPSTEEPEPSTEEPEPSTEEPEPSTEEPEPTEEVPPATGQDA